MNVRQLRFVEGIKKDMRQQDPRRGAELAIRLGQQQVREIEFVKNWEQQYTTSQDRYRFLVLDGPSRQGKTRFAANLVSCDRFLLQIARRVWSQI